MSSFHHVLSAGYRRMLDDESAPKLKILDDVLGSLELSVLALISLSEVAEQGEDVVAVAAAEGDKYFDEAITQLVQLVVELQKECGVKRAKGS